MEKTTNVINKWNFVISTVISLLVKTYSFLESVNTVACPLENLPASFHRKRQSLPCKRRETVKNTPNDLYLLKKHGGVKKDIVQQGGGLWRIPRPIRTRPAGTIWKMREKLETNACDARPACATEKTTSAYHARLARIIAQVTRGQREKREI